MSGINPPSLICCCVDVSDCLRICVHAYACCHHHVVVLCAVLLISVLAVIITSLLFESVLRVGASRGSRVHVFCTFCDSCSRASYYSPSCRNHLPHMSVCLCAMCPLTVSLCRPLLIRYNACHRMSSSDHPDVGHVLVSTFACFAIVFSLACAILEIVVVT